MYLSFNSNFPNSLSHGVWSPKAIAILNASRIVHCFSWWEPQSRLMYRNVNKLPLKIIYGDFRTKKEKKEKDKHN